VWGGDGKKEKGYLLRDFLMLFGIGFLLSTAVQTSAYVFGRMLIPSTAHAASIYESTEVLGSFRFVVVEQGG
jgi:hypothetical protein